MDERRMQRLVGMVVLFTITFLGVLLVANNPASSPFHTGGYDITVQADRAEGVAVNTPVRKDGVLIGRVKDVSWSQQGVLLEVRIDREDVKIYEYDEPQIQPSSIIGDAVISFVRDTDKLKEYKDKEPAPLLAGSLVEARVIDNPIMTISKLNESLQPSILKLGEAGEKIAILADKVNTILGDDIGQQRLHKTMDELTLTLQDFRRTTNNFDQLISDPQLQEDLTQALREIPELMTETRGTMQRAGQTLDNFDNVVASAERNLKNLEGLTEPLGERGEEISDLLISAIDNLDIVMKDLSRFTSDLNNSKGLIGRLVHDEKLGDNAQSVLNNANVLIYNINERVRSTEIDKILYNMKVFSDKIAREPGRLIGGAVKPSITK
ncbi:MlaD family protein [Aeoliella mucimassa]|uniref:Mce related protein n=1 Tax=Aeoliella mucimassa TaxID=2527972 RepID=A0A518AJ20_9BACT|nr:MlaD family protein [Aeoliella mucimassa]QDU54721.1 mce related protein [Aeoliella mucimassa]